MEVFIHNFLVVGDIFKGCLIRLGRVLQHCVETNLVLKWEKCHFMVKEEIVLGIKLWRETYKWIKKKLMSLANSSSHLSQGSKRFSWSCGLLQKIHQRAKITNSFCKLNENDFSFEFDEACLEEFNVLKERFVIASIIVAPNWNLPFEVICGANGCTLGAVLGQRKENYFI